MPKSYFTNVTPMCLGAFLFSFHVGAQTFVPACPNPLFPTPPPQSLPVIDSDSAVLGLFKSDPFHGVRPLAVRTVLCAEERNELANHRPACEVLPSRERGLVAAKPTQTGNRTNALELDLGEAGHEDSTQVVLGALGDDQAVAAVPARSVASLHEDRPAARRGEEPGRLLGLGVAADGVAREHRGFRPVWRDEGRLGEEERLERGDSGASQE